MDANKPFNQSLKYITFIWFVDYPETSNTVHRIPKAMQYKDVCRRTIEIPQCTRIIKVNCC